jgi:hypothetical protein
MKKLTALFLAGVFILSSCAAETPAMSESEESEVIEAPIITASPPVTSQPTEEIPEPPVRQTDEEIGGEVNLQRANTIAETFVNKDTEALSFWFVDRSERAFDFVRELDFAEFELVDYEMQEIEFNEWVTPEWVYYFNITVEDGTDDIFTLGGREWELRFRMDEWPLQQFSPKGAIINKIARGTWSGYAIICTLFSNDLHVFETMSDFNLIADMFEKRENYIYVSGYLYHLTYFISRIQHLLGSGDDEWWNLPADEITAQAASLLGIDNFDSSEVPQIMGHGWYWHYSTLVSEVFTDTGAEIIIDYYADMGYLFVAKTMKYNLEFGEQGVRIVSTELLYSNDDLVMTTGSI